MAKIYLAAAWSRREEIQDVANRLESMGHEITSRWLTNENDSSTTVGKLKPLDPNVNAAQQFDDAREIQHQINAQHDVTDVLKADYLIRFSDADEMAFPLVASKLCSGARHFEMGVAYTMEIIAQLFDESPLEGINPQHKLLFVVGGKQNIFDRLPEVMHVKDTEELMNIMARAAELEGILPYVEWDNNYDWIGSFQFEGEE